MQSAAKAPDPHFETEQHSRGGELDYRVDRVRRDLEQAARGDFTAWALSNAMAAVDAHYRDGKTGQFRQSSAKSFWRQSSARS